MLTARLGARGGLSPPQPSPTDEQGPLWRAVAVFRLAALAYVVVLVAMNASTYHHPVLAWVAVVVMAAWTTFTWFAFAYPQWRGWPLLLADLVVTAAVELNTPWVIGRDMVDDGAPTLAVAWLAGPVLTWAVAGGRRLGLLAALLLGGVEVFARGGFNQATTTGLMLMLLAAIAVGHAARLVVDARRRLQQAVELEAATRERERLARGIHDSVLQVLALVQRRGAHLDGEAGELARLAGEQEAALRALIVAAPPRIPASSAASSAAPSQALSPFPSPFLSPFLSPAASASGRGGPEGDHAAGAGAGIVAGESAGAVVDLRSILSGYAGTTVTLAAPAEPVTLPAYTAREVGRAVGAALDNVAVHCGADAHAWVLVEDEPQAVTVTVRDAGPGIPDGRLAQACAQGRLGVAQSIRGRIADLGGTVTITSTPTEGTEVELRVPRHP